MNEEFFEDIKVKLHVDWGGDEDKRFMISL